jgi:tRNA dimethylallyltransferase
LKGNKIAKSKGELMSKKYLVLVVGPTAVGKTELCVSLAQKLQCDIISCDSRQFYKEMEIGTAKPSLSEMGGVTHHFINSHSITQTYSAGDYERDVEALLATYFVERDVVIMTGGSGLFVKAITEGLDDMPAAPAELRAQLMQDLADNGVIFMQEKLKELDPVAYENMDIWNHQRVVRALEVCMHTGKPFSSFKNNLSKKRDYEIIKIGIQRPREELYERINLRVDGMIAKGLLDEVKSLQAFESHNALQTVGYKEVFGYFKNEYDFTAMVELLKRNTRRYAKRQITWFNNQDSFTWFSPKQFEEILAFVKSKIS